MALFTDTFTGTNGDAWNASKWTTGEAGTASIQSNAGRLAVSGSWQIVNALSSMSAVADQELLLKFKVSSSAEQYLNIAMRGDGLWKAAAPEEPHNGYILSFAVANANEMSLSKMVNDTKTALGSAVNFNISTATWYWVRFRLEGTALKVRAWADGAGEPGTWDIEQTDSAHASGVLQIGLTNNNGGTSLNVDLDDLDVSATAATTVRPRSLLMTGVGS